MSLDGSAEVCLPSHLVAEQLTHGDTGDTEVSGDQRALCSLARTRWRDHKHAHLLPPPDHPGANTQVRTASVPAATGTAPLVRDRVGRSCWLGHQSWLGTGQLSSAERRGSRAVSTTCRTSPCPAARPFAIDKLGVVPRGGGLNGRPVSCTPWHPPSLG